MSAIEWIGGAPHLDERPLADGAELELRGAGDRWLPVVWREGALRLPLGDGAEALLGIDLARVELRFASARGAQVLALARFIESLAPDVHEGDPVELDLLRAHKQFLNELPAAIADYEQRMRDDSFALFRAAQRLRAAEGTEVEIARRELEASALSFAETSQWLGALRMMQDEER